MESDRTSRGVREERGSAQNAVAQPLALRVLGYLSRTGLASHDSKERHFIEDLVEKLEDSHGEWATQTKANDVKTSTTRRTRIRRSILLLEEDRWQGHHSLLQGSAGIRTHRLPSQVLVEFTQHPGG